MTPALPILSGRDVVLRFEQLGWRVVRRQGSHVIMIRPGSPATLSVPDHREVARGTLRSLIRASGSTVEEFVGEP